MEFVLGPSWAALWFWAITVAWALEPRLLRTGRGSVRTRRGRLELWGILFSMLTAILLCALSHANDFLVVDGALGTGLRWVGLILYGLGVALRYWAGWTLGEWFTRDLVVHEDHELIEDGPYAFCRHPLYLALVLATLGLGLLFKTPLTASLGGILVGLALVPRVKREERLLASHFNDR